MTVASRNRWVSIALMTFNSLAFALCVGAGVYQYIGGRLGTISSDSSTSYQLGLTEVLACPNQGYSEVKYIALAYQLTFGNIGLVVAVLALLVSLFFAVGLFGTTRQPPWQKYCALPLMRIKCVLYCTFAIATLLSGMFLGYVLSPFFFISYLNCVCPNALVFQVSLFLEFILAGAALFFCLLCLIFSFFIKVDELEERPDKYLDKNTGDRNITEIPMKTGEENIDDDVLQFAMMKNPMREQRENVTMNYGDIQMGNLREGMLSKQTNPGLEIPYKNQLRSRDPSNYAAKNNIFAGDNQAEKQPEDYPPEMPAYNPYAPLNIEQMNRQMAPPLQKTRRARLQINSIAKETMVEPPKKENVPRKVNPFMNYAPQSPQKPPKLSMRNQPQGISPRRTTIQGGVESNSKKKSKTHPKLESSMKSHQYADEAEPEVPSFFERHAVPEEQQHAPEIRINQDAQGGEQADMTMALMAELNNINFAETNPMNGTYQGGLQDNTAQNPNMSLDIGVSGVFPQSQLGGRTQNVGHN